MCLILSLLDFCYSSGYYFIVMTEVDFTIILTMLKDELQA